MIDHTPPIFYAPGEYTCGEVITLDGEEAKHIALSRRMKLGDEVNITNGVGIKAKAVIENIEAKAKAIDLKITELSVLSEFHHYITLVSAIAKGDRQSVMLNMATQLGMNQFLPLLCDHSVVSFQDKMRQRWFRIIVGACKQSRQYYFPTIGEQIDLEMLFSTFQKDAVFLVGDPDGDDIISVNSAFTELPKNIFLLVGPEGGFSAREREIMSSQNVLKLKLGEQILRSETAAAALLAACNQII